MKFKEVDKSILKCYKKTKILKMLEEFVTSGIAVAEVDSSEYKSVASCVSSIKLSLKRFKMGGVEARTINGKAYIINKTLLEEDDDN